MVDRSIVLTDVDGTNDNTTQECNVREPVDLCRLFLRYGSVALSIRHQNAHRHHPSINQLEITTNSVKDLIHQERDQRYCLRKT